MPEPSTPAWAYFSNRACPYFPCHPAAEPDNFNCLFCFCPLYPLGNACGGHFSLLPQGGKDCSACLYPHLREHHEAVLFRLRDLSTLFPTPSEQIRAKTQTTQETPPSLDGNAL